MHSSLKKYNNVSNTVTIFLPTVLYSKCQVLLNNEYYTNLQYIDVVKYIAYLTMILIILVYAD